MKSGKTSFTHTELSGVLPDQHHAIQHAIDSALVHSGVITDTQHGVRTLASAHAHGNLSGVTADQHHARSHDHSVVADGSPISVAGLPALVGRVTSGSYTGDGTAGRAIPHGLGKVPAVVFLLMSLSWSTWWRIFGAWPYMYYLYITGPNGDRVATTIPDGTNFYVPGGASSLYANANGTGYLWVAISAS